MKLRKKLRINFQTVTATVMAFAVLSHLASTGFSQKIKKFSTKKKSEFVPYNPQKTVLVDVKGKRVLLKTKVVLREGMLEMLCCLKQTKEHESILSLNAKAYVVHTALLAISAEPGKPVKFYPKYVPAEGQKIAIFLQWKDKQGNHHRVPAQKWVRYAVSRYFGEKLDQLPKNLKIPRKTGLFYDESVKELVWFGHMTKEKRDEFLKLSSDKNFRKAIHSFFAKTKIKEMNTDWIFTGSQTYKDRRTGKDAYAGEGGYLICVSNFPAATIDVKAKSSSGENDLLFEPFTKHIPPLGTEVTIELIPVVAKKNKTKK